MSLSDTSLPIDAPEILNREFLEIRAKLLQVAASFDRLDRGDGSVAKDSRYAQLQQALDILRSDRSDTDRAAQIQLLFSHDYDDRWQSTLDMPSAE